MYKRVGLLAVSASAVGTLILESDVSQSESGPVSSHASHATHVREVHISGCMSNNCILSF